MQCQKPKVSRKKKEGLIYCTQLDILRLIHSVFDMLNNPQIHLLIIFKFSDSIRANLQEKRPNFGGSAILCNLSTGGGCCYPNLGHHGGTRANEGFP